jgi:hypothetical protein
MNYNEASLEKFQKNLKVMTDLFDYKLRDIGTVNLIMMIFYCAYIKYF